MTPKVPLRLRIRLWGFTGACWALIFWSRHAYAFLLLVISGALLVGTMVLAVTQIRRSRRI
jgi:hypothetical protein